MIVDGTQGLFDEEVTVTRMIGTVAAKIALGTASLFGTFAMGCIVARGEAIAAGVGSLADPMTDPDASNDFVNTLGDTPFHGITLRTSPSSCSSCASLRDFAIR